MDRRDKNKWYVLELSSVGEQKLEEGTLEKFITKDLGLDPADKNLFIPSHCIVKNGKRHYLHLMQGYVFLNTKNVQEHFLFNLEKKPYITRVLSKFNKGQRIFQVLTDDSIEKLKQELATISTKDLAEEQDVIVKQGLFKNLEGVVVHVLNETAVVKISFRTLELLADIPKIYLEGI